MVGQLSNIHITVLLDTNVFVAAYWAGLSASARLVKACIRGDVQAQYSEEVKREVVHVLRTIRMPESYFRQLEPFWERAVGVKGVSVDPIRAEDPDDQKFLEAAAGGDADFLVTNDDHLLRIGYVGRTEILTPGSLSRILGF